MCLLVVEIDAGFDARADRAHPIFIPPLLHYIISLSDCAFLLLLRHFTHDGTLVVGTVQTLAT